jgi:hypothetical protein
MNDFEVFRSFYVEDDAQELATILRGRGIEVRIENTKPRIDKIIIGHSPEPNTHLKIKSTDFEKANQIIDEFILKNLEDIDKDYYLNSFSTEELVDVLRKPDEWNNQDVILARKLLEERKYSVTETELEKLSGVRAEELKKPAKGSLSWIIVGYAIAIAFGYPGIFFGLFMMSMKKVLPNGTKVLTYDRSTRLHCLAIAVIGTIVTTYILFTRFPSGWDLLWDARF